MRHCSALLIAALQCITHCGTAVLSSLRHCSALFSSALQCITLIGHCSALLSLALQCITLIGTAVHYSHWALQCFTRWALQCFTQRALQCFTQRALQCITSRTVLPGKCYRTVLPGKCYPGSEQSSVLGRCTRGVVVMPLGALRTHTVSWYTPVTHYSRVHHRTTYTAAPLYTRRPACSRCRNSALGSMALFPSGPEVPRVLFPGYCSRIFGSYRPVADGCPWSSGPSVG